MTEIWLESSFNRLFPSQFVIWFYIITTNLIKMCPILIEPFEIHQKWIRIYWDYWKLDQFIWNWSKSIVNHKINWLFDGFCRFPLKLITFYLLYSLSTWITQEMNHATWWCHRSPVPHMHMLVNANDEEQCQQAKNQETYLVRPLIIEG